MLYYLKKYPLSLLIILAVIYLSLFKPPSMDLPPFPYWDKMAHFCMYAGLSGMLWVEYLWNHRMERIQSRRGFIGATLIPILFGGLIELMQAYGTDYRSGDWLDFAANSLGVLTATAIAWCLLRPWLQKRFIG